MSDAARLRCINERTQAATFLKYFESECSTQGKPEDVRVAANELPLCQACNRDGEAAIENEGVIIHCRQIKIGKWQHRRGATGRMASEGKKQESV